MEVRGVEPEGILGVPLDVVNATHEAMVVAALTGCHRLGLWSAVHSMCVMLDGVLGTPECAHDVVLAVLMQLMYSLLGVIFVFATQTFSVDLCIACLETLKIDFAC